MSDPLPPAALRKLEQALAQWRQWADADTIPGAPHLADVLGGISNYTVLVEAGQQQFCVRIDRVSPAANGLNRQAEWRALHRAHAAGLAPRPRYYNPDIGALVCDYLPPDRDQSVSPAALANLLRGIHALPAIHFRLDLAERVRRYRHQLDDRCPPSLAGLHGAAAPLLDCLVAAPGANRLCHNDLSAANLLRSGGRLYALDWEYCAMGSPWFDLATCCNADSPSPDAAELLRHYLQRPLLPAEQNSLEQWRCLADYLDLLWYLSQRPDYLDGASARGRIDALADRLEALDRNGQ